YHMGEGTISVKPLPGAAELLEALSLEPDFVPSVVTGNFEATAQVKLDAAGLASYLWRGAYASDSEQRRDLPAIAKNRCEVRAGRILNADRCIIIGDTPKDVEAARANHMKCVLVGTGRYPVEELEYWQAEACLPDLRGTGAILDLLANL
ncbi:MAG TPA: HAD hydrolase-like protein, partial [Terriglobales bacterium]|nr:HAD hydrolase-like protein [Terriglobales bacterium]